jgi:hypothetical protein
MASPGDMLDGDASAAPAPKSVAPAAITESAVDKSDRLASTRPVPADDVVLSPLVFMSLTVMAKGKGSLSVLGGFGGES